MSTSEMQKAEPSNNSNFFKSLNMTRYVDYLKSLLYKESYIPTLNITINIPTTDNDSKFPRTLVSVVAKNIDGWANIKNENDIIIEPVKGALTNNIYFITNISSNKKIILRVYGKGVDKLLNREKELEFLKMLSKVDIGPQLLLIFNNGRFEQFFESVNLTKEEMKDEEISRKIATYMFRLHNVVTIFPPNNIENIVPEVWSNIDQWFQLAWDIINSGSSDSSNNINTERFDLKLLKKEIKELKSILQTIDSPIVFAHNDCQYGNILRLTDGSNQLAIIDLEYAGWNTRGFDIGNHLCEWAFDYHSTEPHVAHLDWYPNEQQERNFLESYLDSFLLASNNKNKNNNSIPRDKLLKNLKIEADGYSLASHIMWGLWGIVQSAQSQIKFNYLEYSWQRINAFRTLKDKIYKDISDETNKI